MNKTGRVLGTIFVVLGTIFLLRNLNIINFSFDIFNFGNIISRFWPLIFMILPSLLFHYGYLAGKRKDPGLLVPGGMLLVLGTTFQINMLFGFWDVLWPIYIFAVAFGLFELYIFGNKDKGLLIPIGILGGLSIIFFSAFSLKALLGNISGQILTPVVLILIGLVVIFGGRGKKNSKKF
jgi:hypothetical protein